MNITSVGKAGNMRTDRLTMETPTAVFVCILLFSFHCVVSEPLRFEKLHDTEPNEAWGYVDVREGAHMFYWLYETTNPSGASGSPLVMWLQGGPGGSGTGFGNFGEMGPLDVDMKPRNTTWLQAASLLFVDNPVGSGYSYVDRKSDLTTDVVMIAADMMVLLETFFMEKQISFQGTPFYIFSESYGGKMTAAISAALHQAIQDKTISCNFQGLAMGDSWISPVASTAAWGPYLYTNSLIDLTGLIAVNTATNKSVELAKGGNWTGSTEAWGFAEDVVESRSNGVNFYNILKWGQEEESSVLNFSDSMSRLMLGKLHEDKLTALMNGPIKKKLGIPEKVVWGATSQAVFEAQKGDFMKPITDTVNTLIEGTNLKVVVYSGQLDLIVSTIGTEYWVYNTLDISEDFQKAKHVPLLHPVTGYTSAYVKTAKNFSFYWILDAGHMVPSDNAEMALKMLKMIISP